MVAAPRIEHTPGRFVARLDEGEAYVVYERRGAVLDVLHTYTPPALRGRAVAAHLTQAVVAHAQAHGLRIRPTCSYTRDYLARHPELRSLVAEAPGGSDT